MGRFSFNSSSAALVLAATALFVALGGPAWAGSLIGTSQIRNGAITSNKIGRHQVKTANIADGAVTATQVKRASLTAADVAPGAFLAADGRAQDSKALGGKPATDYLTGAGGVTGAGGMVDSRISVPIGQTAQVLNLGIALVKGNCSATGAPTLTYVSEVTSVSVVASAIDSMAPPSVTATNNLTTGGSFTQPNTIGDTQAVTFQAAFGTNHTATAWTTGQPATATGCLFIGQALTTG
jgi:hypothetical protein